MTVKPRIGLLCRGEKCIVCDMQHYICAESACAATRELIKELGKALKRVKKLEQCNAQKDERIRQLEREKEALINIAKRSDSACLHCKHFCYVCTRPSKEIRLNGDCFEWRGVEEDEA